MTENVVVESAEDLRVEKLAALGRAMSDPIRIKMLGMLAVAASEGRGCCGLPALGAPVNDEDDSSGICVCEFTEVYGLGQSKVSYHLGKLKEAGLVMEEKRGRWSFYSLDVDAAGDLLDEAGEHLGRGAGAGSAR